MLKFLFKYLTLFGLYLGRILKDEQTLESYEITDGLTVHLVKGKTAAAAGQPSAAGASTTATPSSAGTGADPMAGLGGMGGMGGMGMPGMGMPGMGMPGMGMPGMGMGMPNMAAGAGGPRGMGGLGGMDPAMMSQMMNNPMVQ